MKRNSGPIILFRSFKDIDNANRTTIFLVPSPRRSLGKKGGGAWLPPLSGISLPPSEVV